MSFEIVHKDCDTVTIHRANGWLREYVETGINVDPTTLGVEVGRVAVTEPGRVVWPVPERGLFNPAAWYGGRLVYVWQVMNFELGHNLSVGPFPLEFQVSSV